MRLIKPSIIIEGFYMDDPHSMERIGRVCYKSEDKITDDSAEKFLKARIGHHESVIEHSALTVRFICDRGVSHELVRHRLCAFSQESTRYCNYKGGVTFIIPLWCDIKEGEYATEDHTFYNDVASNAVKQWYAHMALSEVAYINLLAKGDWSPQQARTVLPNSLKTEIIVTTNFREWRHIFKLRTENAAHPQMRELMQPLLDEVKTIIPYIFDDISY